MLPDVSHGRRAQSSCIGAGRAECSGEHLPPGLIDAAREQEGLARPLHERDAVEP